MKRFDQASSSRADDGAIHDAPMGRFALGKTTFGMSRVLVETIWN